MLVVNKSIAIGNTIIISCQIQFSFSDRQRIFYAAGDIISATAADRLRVSAGINHVIIITGQPRCACRPGVQFDTAGNIDIVTHITSIFAASTVKQALLSAAISRHILHQSLKSRLILRSHTGKAVTIIQTAMVTAVSNILTDLAAVLLRCHCGLLHRHITGITGFDFIITQNIGIFVDLHRITATDTVSSSAVFICICAIITVTIRIVGISDFISVKPHRSKCFAKSQFTCGKIRLAHIFADTLRSVDSIAVRQILFGLAVSHRNATISVQKQLQLVNFHQKFILSIANDCDIITILSGLRIEKIGRSIRPGVFKTTTQSKFIVQTAIQGQTGFIILVYSFINCFPIIPRHLIGIDVDRFQPMFQPRRLVTGIDLPGGFICVRRQTIGKSQVKIF